MAKLGGGYDYEFVDAPPKSLECSICLLTLRDPHVVSCCGNHFCYSCINRINSSNKLCPLCNEPGFTTFLHKGVAREVNALKIYCPNKPQGCDWQGELGQVEKHLNPKDKLRERRCGFVMVECKYTCGNRFYQRMIERHETEECPRRPMEVQMAHLMRKFESLATESRAEIEAIRQESNAKIQAMKQESVSKAEMEVIRQENREIREKSRVIEAEVQLLKAENVRLKKQLEIHSPPASVPPFYFTVQDYKHYLKNNLSLFSPPFYSHPGGYKMRLEVFPGGESEGYLSLYVRVLRGEYDDNLQWPFNGDIVVEMYNWTSEKWAHRRVVDIRETECGERSVDRAGCASLGFHHFISNAMLQKEYLVNEKTIRFRVKEVTRKNCFVVSN